MNLRKFWIKALRQISSFSSKDETKLIWSWKVHQRSFINKIRFLSNCTNKKSINPKMATLSVRPLLVNKMWIFGKSTCFWNTRYFCFQYIKMKKTSCQKQPFSGIIKSSFLEVYFNSPFLIVGFPFTRSISCPLWRRKSRVLALLHNNFSVGVKFLPQYFVMYFS